MAQLDLPEGKLKDPLWQDKIEILPNGNMMLVADIVAMTKGKPFKVYTGLGVPPKRYGPIDPVEAVKHIEFYAMSKRWGLPSGKGWANETEFCMKLLMHLDELADRIDEWRIEQATRR